MQIRCAVITALNIIELGLRHEIFAHYWSKEIENEYALTKIGVLLKKIYNYQSVGLLHVTTLHNL